MIFSSLEFLCIFFPVVFILYCLTPGIRLKNMLLIAASLLFYAYGEPGFVLLMISSAGFNYLSARMIGKFFHKKALLLLNVLFNLGLLVYFKYAVFLLESWYGFFGGQGNVPEIELPIGISFFTFQALSYVLDVYYGRIEAEKNFGKVLLYISFFPQLVAGPIIKYREIEKALGSRRMDLGQITEGMRRFICGLGKKVLIANTVGQAADAVFGASASEVGMLSAWIGAAAYMLQIYYDFSGYSDMAIGLGKMFGFRFPENFRYPYGAAGIREFWRRWHISLSAWFKEYLYIPLGGNRKGKLRTGCNKLIVFLSTGLWHGANWTFVLWGLYHGFFSILEDHLPFFDKIPRMITRLYTVLVVCAGFVMFRADNVSQGFFLIRQMFTGSFRDSVSQSFAFSLLTPWFAAMMLAGLIGMAPIRSLTERMRAMSCMEGGQEKENGDVRAALSIASLLLLAWCMIRLSGNTYNPFIYFRF